MRVATVVGVSVMALAGLVGGTALLPQDTALLMTASYGGVDDPVAVADAPASTVRGQLYRRAADGRAYPAQGIAVRVNHPSYGPSSFSYSDMAGMYYLFGIPAGQFALEVWLTQQDVRKFAITVRDSGYTDIAPIEVP